MDFFDPDFSLKETDTKTRAAPYDPSIARFHSGESSWQKEVRVAAATPMGIKSLRELCAVAVAGLVDHVESLDNIPWGLAKLVYDQIEAPSPAAVSLYARDFPEEFGSWNSHLCYRDYKLCPRMVESLKDAWFGSFLKALDLSCSDFNDDLCAAVSNLEGLELLDLSSTEITNNGLRNLCRTMVHSEKDRVTGLPLSGLKNLTYLNLSMCGNLTAKDLDEILSRFPCLLAIGLNRTYVQRMGVVTKMKELFGWIEAPQRVNFFPGFRGGVSSPIVTDPESASALNSFAASSEGGPGIQTSTFFGTQLKATTQNLKKQTDNYFKYRAFKLDEETSKWARRTMNPEYQAVLDGAWSLLQHKVPDSEALLDFQHIFASTNSRAEDKSKGDSIDLPEYNDLYEAVVGKSRLTMHRKMNPWYLPFNRTKLDSNTARENDILVSEIVESEIHGRLCLIRSEAQRDLELKKVVDSMNQATINRKKLSQIQVGVNAKSADMVKKCAKRLEPAPKTVTVKSAQKSSRDGVAIGHLPDFGEFLDMEKGMLSFPTTITPTRVVQPSKAPPKSGLFKLLSKK